MTSEEIVRQDFNELITRLRPLIYVKGKEEQANNLEVLGSALSKYCEWSGAGIMEVSLHALHDANFHTLADKIEGMMREEGIW